MGDVTLATIFYTQSFSTEGGTGDFNLGGTEICSIAGTPFCNSPSSFVMDVSGGVGPSTFTIQDNSGFGWGTFTATQLVYIHPGSNAMNYGFLGNFTPGSYECGGTCTANTASLIVGFTQAGGTGSAISESLSLNTPATDLLGAPEPATLGLFGSAFVALGLLRRRRKV